MELSVKIGKRTLKNPVGVASGTFGYGQEFDPIMDLSKLGAIYTKAVSMEPRLGNATPRIVETPSGMLNAIGLQNVGVEAFLEEKLPFLSQLDTAAIVNVVGYTDDDYCNVIKRLDGQEAVWGYEINLSCPNVKVGAIQFGTDPDMVEQLTMKMRAFTEKPLLVKLSPNVTDIAEIAVAAERGGADAVTCINTLVGMVIDIEAQETVLANKTGGLSGPAIRPIGVRMTHQVSHAIDIPVVGIGGITSADDAIQYLLAGAKAIQVGTWNFVEPESSEHIADGIAAYMEKHGLQNIDEFAALLDRTKT
jgi:dihydroorotate dehydrogenase (NAD+) catalytic subunit